MLTTFERIVAWRYLRAKRKESFVAVILMFSLLGITLGVMTLIVVMSVMNGVRDEMLKNFVGLSGHIQVVGQGTPLSDYTSLAQKIQAIPGVASATPMIEGQVMLTANGQARGVQVRAMPKLPREIQDKITLGGMGRFEHGDGILIGERLARNLGLLPGRKVTFISPDGRQTVLGLVPRMKAYTVSGIFTFGMSSIDGALVVMPFSEAQTFFKLTDNGADQASGIEVKLKNIDDTAKVAATIDAAINKPLNRPRGGAQRGGMGEYPPSHEVQLSHYRVFDWRQTNAAVFEALNVQRVVMFLILMLIILVAAFNIISSLIMLVKDKQRDIAILRAMGATRGMVQRIFMLSGLAVGALGTFFGMLLGLLLAYNLDDIRRYIEAKTGHQLLGEQLYFIASLPAKVDMAEVLLVVLMSLGLSLLATLYPARRAAALNPAEALRYE